MSHDERIWREANEARNGDVAYWARRQLADLERTHRYQRPSLLLRILRAMGLQ